MRVFQIEYPDTVKPCGGQPGLTTRSRISVITYTKKRTLPDPVNLAPQKLLLFYCYYYILKANHIRPRIGMPGRSNRINPVTSRSPS